MKPLRTYISADIETNGMVAGMHSMISLGCSAHNQFGTQISTFETNLEPYPDLKEDPGTMNWWKKYPDQYAQATKDPLSPYNAIIKYHKWLKTLQGEIVILYHNAPFDYSFVRYTEVREVGRSAVFTALDTRQLAWATGKFPSFNYIKKSDIAQLYGIKNDNAHGALSDAVEQAEIFFKLAEELGLEL